MTMLQAVVLGLVQGVTEFLPVSSSGHLVLAQSLFGIEQVDVSFSLVVHLATLAAVVVFFAQDLVRLRLREWMLIAFGSVPVVIVGFLLRELVEGAFTSELLVASMLLITGALNFWSDRQLEQRGSDEAFKKSTETPAPTSDKATSELAALTPWRALLVGCFQAAAIIPGISRSGSTLAGALFQGLEREAAFKFVFFLSLPAVGGAAVLYFFEALQKGVMIETFASFPFAIGALSAFISGMASLFVLRFMIAQARLEWFAWYCWLVGGGSLLLLLF